MATRLASVPLLIIIGVAIYTTKIPLLAKAGFWKTAHEARTDLAMMLGALFLILAGAGAWSLEARFAKPNRPNRKERSANS